VLEIEKEVEEGKRKSLQNF